MPGIVGIIGTGTPEEKTSELQKMVECMMHEPFYNSGVYSNDRLGIWVGWISHKNSFSDCMPVWNETKDVCIIFSGEDFTDQSKIERLRANGHELDLENASYIVHLYEEMGIKFIEKLNGRFSGLLIDLRESKTALFNDRYGLDRIYYHDNPNGFYFASEAKALLKVVPNLRELNMASLGEFFSCGCSLQNRTLFSGISLLPGASVWTRYPGQRMTKKSYFRPQTWENQTPLSIPEYYKQLKETWANILPRYFRGNEKTAMSLTGGKDSRMIMAWVRHPAGKLPCYTFGGMFRDCEDVKLARLVANICHQPHQVIQVGRDFLSQFPTLAEKTVYLTDGSMDVSAATELYVNRIARTIAPVRLTGNYGQEILRGAIAFKPTSLHEEILSRDFGQFVRTAVQTYTNELNSNKLSFVAFKQMPWHHYSRLAVEMSQLSIRSPYLDNDLVSLAFQTPAELAISIKPQLSLIDDGNPAMGKTETDRGLLYRSVPMVTKIRHLYQQFTFKAEYAYDYGMPQWLTKIDHLFEQLHFERLFLGRHKFYHFRIWYRDELSQYIKEVLLDPQTLARPYLNGRRVEDIVNSHITGNRNYTSEIHKLLTSELIQRQLIENI